MSDKIPKIVQQITYWPIYLVLKVFFRYSIESQENLEGLENKGVIFASNHASTIDGPFCAAAMPREGIVPKKFFPVRFLAAREYCEWLNPKNFPFPIFFFTTAYVKANGSIPVERRIAGRTLEEKLSEAIKALKAGAKVWIYPEGRITRDGKLQSGKKGAVFLHQKTGAPIVPVGLIGTFKILTPKILFKTLIGQNRVKVKIGKPIYLPASVDLEEGTETVMQEIAELLK
jgi:1-acyl-sn-glycerol-3-phosphate acyltransferase